MVVDRAGNVSIVESASDSVFLRTSYPEIVEASGDDGDSMNGPHCTARQGTPPCGPRERQLPQSPSPIGRERSDLGNDAVPVGPRTASTSLVAESRCECPS